MYSICKAQKIFKPLLILGLLTLVYSCSATVEYVGKEYTPTQNVDIYLDSKDIKKNYAVMGRVDGISGLFGSEFSEIQDKIVQVAREKGADGVILYNMEKRVVGSSTSTSTSRSSGHRSWLNMSTFSQTQTNTENVLHADFIKYTKE